MDQGKEQYIHLDFESKEAGSENQAISTDYFALLNLQQTNHIEHQLFQIGKDSKAGLAKYFKDHNINYSPSSFEKDISISILYHTANYEAMKISVKYGFFSMQLTVVNVDVDSPSNNLQMVSSGGFGDVYKTWAEQQQIVVKKIRFQDDQYSNTLRQTIKQYFILKLASSLYCGPKLCKIYGFDIVCFRDAIEFSMECCNKNAQLNSSLHDLKKKLHLLHNFHIIHCDIKPDNVAYSRLFSCYVFLDFGLSFIAKEKIGQKTVTSFVGSVQYCTKQLWELFMKGNTDAVDLYLNDAFTLNKTISAFQLSSPVVQRQSSSLVQEQNQLIFVDGKDPQKFYKLRSIIFLKAIFFRISMDNTFKESDLANHLQYLDTDMSKIVEFVKMLPLNELLIYLFKKYCKYGEDDDIDRGIYKTCVRSIQDQTRREDSIYSAFLNRYNCINLLNYSRSGHQLINKFRQRQRRHQVIEKSQVKKDNSAYSMIIVRMVKINGQTDNFDDKIYACKDYLSKFCIDFQQMTHKEIYKKTILQIFNRSLQIIQTDRLILFHTIQTIIILEILSQDHLLQAFKLILKASLNFVQKMSFVLEFFIALQFINQKYKTSYTYEDIIEKMLINLNDQLDTIFCQSEMTMVEQLCFYRLKQLIIERIGYVGQIKNQLTLPQNHKSYKDQAVSQQIKLICDIHAYLLYLEGYYEFNNGNINLQCYHKQISKLIESENLFVSHFSYLHFYYFDKTLGKNEDHFNFLTYQLFEKQLGPFQESIHYKIYFKYKVKTLNRNLLQTFLAFKISKQQKQEHIIANVLGKNIKCIQQVLELFKLIIKETNQFHKYFSIFFELISIQNLNLVQLLKQFFVQNIKKLVAFSNNYHKQGYFNHNNSLKTQITTINNIIHTYKKLTHFDVSGLIENYFQQAFQVISNCECFYCKSTCLLELKFIYAYNYNKQHPEQQIIVLADIVTVFFKHPQLFWDIERAILNIAKFIGRNRQIRQKFCLRQFLYFISMKRQNACFCLTYLRQYNMFIQVYLHILQFYSQVQLSQFVLQILKVIKIRRSTDHIIKFYYNCLTMIKLSRQDKQPCKNYYRLVLKYLFNHEKAKQNPYISIYLLALLQMKIKGIFQQKIFKIIKKGLLRVDHFTKRLLLSQYYMQYIFYFEPVKKKLKFLKKLHLKHSLTELSRQLIFKQKISSRNTKRACPMKLNKLKHAINKYHYTLQNLKDKNSKK